MLFDQYPRCCVAFVFDNPHPRPRGVGDALDEAELRRVELLIDDRVSPVGVPLLDLHRRNASPCASVRGIACVSMRL
jgi:hypothetical protein